MFGTKKNDSTAGLSDAALGQEQFLKLLIEQLKNQDPLNPMDSTDFTAQLAQFSSLEQLFGINKN
ncbi:MAG TPA: flagellar hook assembly protein FlgD, partial [Proteobacteria bacterium]|nr:flagellar hook assembly protein FlgD [Pseudomonadota bacterium]